jgi:hypothetical protein
VVRGILEFFTALRGTIVIAARRAGVRNLSIAAAGLGAACLAVGGAVLGADAWLGADPDVGSLWREQADDGSGSGGAPTDDAAAVDVDASTEVGPAGGDRSRPVGRAATSDTPDGVDAVAGERALTASAAAGSAGGPQSATATPSTTTSSATTAGQGGTGRGSGGEDTPGTAAPTPTTASPTTTAPTTAPPGDGGGVLSGLLDLLGLG